MELSDDELRRAYESMRTMRVFDEVGRREFMAGTLPGFIHMYCGEEAIAAGICADLTDQDYINFYANNTLQFEPFKKDSIVITKLTGGAAANLF